MRWIGPEHVALAVAVEAAVAWRNAAVAGNQHLAAGARAEGDGAHVGPGHPRGVEVDAAAVARHSGVHARGRSGSRTARVAANSRAAQLQAPGRLDRRAITIGDDA